MCVGGWGVQEPCWAECVNKAACDLSPHFLSCPGTWPTALQQDKPQRPRTQILLGTSSLPKHHVTIAVSGPPAPRCQWRSRGCPGGPRPDTPSAACAHPSLQQSRPPRHSRAASGGAVRGPQNRETTTGTTCFSNATSRCRKPETERPGRGARFPVGSAVSHARK